MLDATVELPAPRADGDHRAESGLTAFQAGHVPGARHADLLGPFSDEVTPYHFGRPSPARLVRALRDVGVADRRPIVCYDTDGGIWSARLCYVLQAAGLEAAVLDGGWRAWVDAGGAVEAGEPAAPEPPVLTLALAGGDSFWAEKEEVAEVTAGARPGTLVCALSPEAFAGAVPTRYRRRGHIPRSANLPARSLLSPDGGWPAPARLRRALSTVVSSDGPIITYCGGGVSATVVALALRLVGREDVKVYDGSLEEWSEDPLLPLELGSP